MEIVTTEEEWDNLLTNVLLDGVSNYKIFRPKRYPILVFYDLDTYIYRKREYRYASIFYPEDYPRILRYLSEIKNGKKYAVKVKSYDSEYKKKSGPRNGNRNRKHRRGI